MLGVDWEARLLARLLDWLTRFLEAVGSAILAAFKFFGSQPDPTAVYTQAPLWTEAVEDMMDLLEEAAADGWSKVSDVDMPSNEAFAAKQLATTRNLLTRIPDEVYHQVFAAITDGTTQGESNEQIADRVQEVLTVTGSANWRGRAKTIAITETNRAFNAGSYAAALYSEQVEGITLTKEWVAKMHGKGAERTRETHRAADGQKVPLRQSFSVGGANLMFPGDPSGPPQEVIGCRCSLVYE
jgi:hypothetical protein